ncbi:MAG: class I SAM-dependent methyltransferase [Akkermansiaceae bacterium]
MPNSNHTSQTEPHSDSLGYSNMDESATPSFKSAEEKITAEILRQGVLPFPKFLEIALYDPEFGYYARPPKQVGRSGDFYTSVSVGPLFGRILARRFLKWWLENGSPSAWRLVELGAHDGKLAADILAEIAAINPTAWGSLEFCSIEPLPQLRKAQHQRLDPLASKLHIAESANEISADSAPTILYGNEVLDALPFHLIRMRNKTWMELFVTEHFEFTEQEPSARLQDKLKIIGNNFPENYQTEIRTSFQDFLEPLLAIGNIELLLFIDYGFASPEYYDTYRSKGTMRTFSKQKAAEDPFQDIGQIDITAHVDFTDLSRVLIEKGIHPSHFSNQSSYLTHLAAEMITNEEIKDRHTVAQFQTLTHPSQLGNRFHAIEFAKNQSTPPSVNHRLALL